jgi:hypothetical protein
MTDRPQGVNFQNRLSCGNEGVRVRLARNCPMAEGLNPFSSARESIPVSLDHSGVSPFSIRR